MTNEQIKVKATSSGQMLDVVVYSKQLNVIQVVIGAGTHSVKGRSRIHSRNRRTRNPIRRLGPISIVPNWRRHEAYCGCIPASRAAAAHDTSCSLINAGSSCRDGPPVSRPIF